jgi:phosphopantetheinyl transferase (holo-ACP synthase)
MSPSLPDRAFCSRLAGGTAVVVARVSPDLPEPNLTGAAEALTALFAAIPSIDPESDLVWHADPLGKPILIWAGELARWAGERGLDDRHLHVSNTHDREFHFVAVAYGDGIAGVGVDVVALERLQRRERGHLLRLARRIMGDEEWNSFESAVAGLTQDELVVRTAAHFSLMEAASKALGTGLALGLGLGRPGSVPARSIGIRRLAPEIELLFDGPAAQRMADLGAAHARCRSEILPDHALATVLLLRADGVSAG